MFKSGNAYVLNKGEHLSVNTTVKGDKDSKYGQMANVTTGEKANYRLTLDNDTDDKVTSLNILNVLPTVGDSNVLDGEARNSAYVMKMTKAITLPKAWQDKVDVYYTTSANPKRTGTIDVDTTYPTGATKVIDPVGAEEATWVNADQVKDWSTIHAFKIVMKDGVEWVQGKGVEINFDLQAPEANEITDPSFIINKPASQNVSTKLNGKDASALVSSTHSVDTIAVASNHLQPTESAAMLTQLIRKSSPVTAKYVDEDGNEIAKSETLTGYVGDAYKTQQKDIAGYSFDKVTGETTGEFSDVPVTVTYIYTKDKTSAAPVTTKYVDEDGNEIAKSETLTGYVGDAYKTEQKKISGYSFDKVTGKTTGEFSELPVTVTYVYEKDKTSIVTPPTNTEKPTPPTNHEKPAVSDKKEETKKMKLSTKFLPQTDEQVSVVAATLSVVGVVLLSVLVLLRLRKRHL